MWWSLQSRLSWSQLNFLNRLTCRRTRFQPWFYYLYLFYWQWFDTLNSQRLVNNFYKRTKLTLRFKRVSDCWCHGFTAEACLVRQQRVGWQRIWKQLQKNIFSSFVFAREAKFGWFRLSIPSPVPLLRVTEAEATFIVRETYIRGWSTERKKNMIMPACMKCARMSGMSHFEPISKTASLDGLVFCQAVAIKNKGGRSLLVCESTVVDLRECKGKRRIHLNVRNHLGKCMCNLLAWQ